MSDKKQTSDEPCTTCGLVWNDDKAWYCSNPFHLAHPNVWVTISAKNAEIENLKHEVETLRHLGKLLETENKVLKTTKP